MFSYGGLFEGFDYNALMEYTEKLHKGELTVEDILRENTLTLDIKNKSCSEFVNFFDEEKIKKLIDYSIKMPESDDQMVGHQFPFNATEILCSGDAIQNKIMNPTYLQPVNYQGEVNYVVQNQGINYVVNSNLEISSGKESQKKHLVDSDEEIKQETFGKLDENEDEEENETNNFEEQGFIRTIFNAINKAYMEKQEEKEKIKKQELNNLKNLGKEFDFIKVKPKIPGESNIYFENKTLDFSIYSNKDNASRNEQNNSKDTVNKQDTPVKYKNLDYLFKFLDERNKDNENSVLLGYFSKIIISLIENQNEKIVNYIFNYPNKTSFDILDLMVKKITNKSIEKIINKLLLFTSNEETEDKDLINKKIELIEKIIEQLEANVNNNSSQSKIQSICNSIEKSTENEKFFILFIKNGRPFSRLFDLYTKSKNITVLYLLIKFNIRILRNLPKRITQPIPEENHLAFLSQQMSFFGGGDQISDIEKNENAETLIDFLKVFFDKILERKIELLQEEENGQKYITTYLQEEKKFGEKRLTQINYLQGLIEVLVNSYALDYHKDKIEKIINIIKEEKILEKLNSFFFEYPNNNMFHIYHQQIIEVIMNKDCPISIVGSVLQIMNNNNNLIDTLMNRIIEKIKFTYKSGRVSLTFTFPFEISILNKIFASQNPYIVDLIKNNKDFSVFNEIIGKEINRIYTKTLLKEEGGIFKDFQNLTDDKDFLDFFGRKNFMGKIDELCQIYDLYKNGGDYKKALEEKSIREKQEKEEINKEYKKELDTSDDQLNIRDELISSDSPVQNMNANTYNNEISNANNNNSNENKKEELMVTINKKDNEGDNPFDENEDLYESLYKNITVDGKDVEDKKRYVNEEDEEETNTNKIEAEKDNKKRINDSNLLLNSKALSFENPFVDYLKPENEDDNPYRINDKNIKDEENPFKILNEKPNEDESPDKNIASVDYNNNKISEEK